MSPAIRWRPPSLGWYLSKDKLEEGWLVDDIANLHGSTVIPAEILRRFADTVISVRELEVLWLEYHGLERAQIAAELSITSATVTTHWKNVQRKLELDREGVRKWIGDRLASAGEVAKTS